MFDRHIRELQQHDEELDHRIREIDRIDAEMVDLSKKITACVLAEKIDEDLLSSYKHTYTELKNEREWQRADIEDIKEKMRIDCRHLDNLIGGIKK